MSSRPAASAPCAVAISDADRAVFLAQLLFDHLPDHISPDADRLKTALDRWLYALSNAPR